MHMTSRQQHSAQPFLAALLAVSLFSAASAWQGSATATAKAKAAPALTAAERKAAAGVKLETIRDVTAKLSAPEFEGRGTAQPGGERAARYLADRFKALGLQPAGEDGTYLQPIKFKSAEVLKETNLMVGEATLKHGSDFVVLPPYSAGETNVSSDLVFVGYGAVSEELKRDDFAGLDLKGKIVVLLNGQPAGVDPDAWRRASNPQARGQNLFGRGAAALIVGNAGTAAQPFATIAKYLSRRRVSLATAPESQFKLPPILLASDETMEKVFAGSEMSYAKTLEQAKSGANVSRNLQKQGSLALRTRMSEAIGNNVVAVMEGSDPKLKTEAVVYSAHYDAYGTEGGQIFPGAADNALGTATITAIAEAFVQAYPKPMARPRRSIVFLAVTGEEYGLLGAEHWVQHPTWPLEKIAADINFDGIGTEVYAPVKRIVGFGAEHSDLGAVFADVTEATGNIVTPDPMPEENAFVRSDHYAFVKKGVPALMLLGGPAEDVSIWIPRAREWLETDYHSPSDTIKPDWDWTGPQTLARVGMIIGLRVANAPNLPVWNASSPFNKPRGARAPLGQ